MALDATAIAAVLKEQWPEGMDLETLYQNRPLLGMIAREKDFTGEYYNVPIQHALGSARSNDFSVASAAANAKDNAYSQFQVTSVTDYGYGTIGGSVVRRGNKSEGSAHQFINALTAAVESAVEQMSQTCSQRAYRAATGAICQLNTDTPSGTTITLDQPSSVRYFQVGDVLVFSVADGGLLTDSGDSIAVTAVDRDSGTLAVENVSAVAGLAASEFVYIKGSAQNNSTAVAAAGLGSWCPTAAPTTALFGVTRTTNQALLGGRRVSSTGESIETIFTKAHMLAVEAGFEPDVCFIHPQDAGRISNTKEGTRLVSDKFALGFPTLEANGRRFTLDADCPEGYAFMMDFKGGRGNRGAYRWLTNGEIEIEEADGAPLSRVATADEYEMRLCLDHNFAAFNPGKIVRIPVPTS